MPPAGRPLVRIHKGKSAQALRGALGALGGLPLLGRDDVFIKKASPSTPGRPGGPGWPPTNRRVFIHASSMVHVYKTVDMSAAPQLVQ